MPGNDVAVFVSEIGATHGLQQWVIAHDASISISTSNSHERYGISKSDEVLSFVKFDMWFCDSFVHLPDSKSIHWQNQCCHQCAHCEVARFPDALSLYTVSVSQFSLQFFQTRNRATFARKFSDKFLAPYSWICTNLWIKIWPSTKYIIFTLYASSAILQCLSWFST